MKASMETNSLAPSKWGVSDLQKEYDDIFKTQPIRDEDRAYRWFAGQVFKDATPKNLLDIGCGGGYFLRELQIHGKAGNSNIIGIDLSVEGLKIARAESPKSSLAISVGEYLPFKSNSMDAVTCLGSLEHFLDIDLALKEMARVVSAKGRVYILVPNLFWYKDLYSVWKTGNKKDRNQHHERFACLGEWTDIITKNGLAIKQSVKYNGIAKHAWKQSLKDVLIPLKFSYHFLFICGKQNG